MGFVGEVFLFRCVGEAVDFVVQVVFLIIMCLVTVGFELSFLLFGVGLAVVVDEEFAFYAQDLVAE